MDPFIGEIRAFAGNFAPNGWFLCQGQLLPISAYQALFAIIGTFYGGNGTSNFQLPNLQGRVMLGVGQSQYGTTYNVGEIGGVEQTTLGLNNMPAHTHVAVAAPHTHSVTVPPHTHPFAPLCDNVAGLDATPSGEYPGHGGKYSKNSNQPMASQTTGQNADGASGVTGSTTETITIQPAGSGLPFNAMTPFVGISYIIAYQGVFPSRG